MSRYWSELVKTLTPYVPGEQPQHKNLVKLNTNECPYPPSPAVVAAIAAVDADKLRLYPDPQSSALKAALAERNGLRPEQVFVGNGSDEVLAFTYMGLLKQSQPLYFPDISYSFYPVWAGLAGVEYSQVPVAADFTIDPDAYPQENGGIIVPNPNAPTGIVMGPDTVTRLLQRSPDSVVVIDEAYIDFGGSSAVELIDDFDNLLVIQTFSKSRALAGLRVGVAMGHASLIEALERVKNSFNSYTLDVVAQAAALASLGDDAYFQNCCEQITTSREHLIKQLDALGFSVLPSAANFVFVTHPDHSAESLFKALRERGLVVRYFDKPRIDEYLRITVGTEAECDALMAGFAELLK